MLAMTLRCGAVGPWLLLCFLLNALVLAVAAQVPEGVTQTTEEPPCRVATESFSCYHCKTNSHHADNYCGDPFNDTHPELDVVQCSKDAYCTKWVVQLQSGAIQTMRTCSSEMELVLKIYTVCMTESGSDDGHLCFCDGELCNAATSWTAITSLWKHVISSVLIASVAGYSNVVSLAWLYS